MGRPRFASVLTVNANQSSPAGTDPAGISPYRPSNVAEVPLARAGTPQRSAVRGVFAARTA